MSHRTQITLTDELYARLREASSETGLSLAELVRRAVSRTYSSRAPGEVLTALDASFDRWEGEEDGAAWVERRRRGLSERLPGR